MNDIRFIYGVKEARQLAFDGINRVEDVFNTACHISYLGSILCGTDKAKISAAPGTIKVSDVSNRPSGVSMCPECEKKYKNSPNLDWQRWARSSL